MNDNLCPSCLSLGESVDDSPDGTEMRCPICGDEWFVFDHAYDEGYDPKMGRYYAEDSD